MSAPEKSLNRPTSPPWNSVAMRSYMQIEDSLRASLTWLGTADKCRVLLALHQLIADQLEALEVNTETGDPAPPKTASAVRRTATTEREDTE